MATHTVTLSSDTDWPGFRGEARALLARQVPPEDVVWHTRASAESDLFAALETPRAQGVGSASAIVPPAFVRLCETVVLHDDPDRFGLLYRLLWRLVHEPTLRRDPLDADRVRAQHMAQAVRRDMHKMKAFVRFRPLPQDDGEPTLHVAWFEPDHHIVEAVAPFFVRRFATMRWAILTPERSVQWHPGATADADGGEALPTEGRLDFGPGARREDAPPADAGEALWLTYYRHIFNPARLKLAMMQKEMPRRYWQNLPEAVLIAPLAADAAARSDRMVDAPATVPARRIVPIVRPLLAEEDTSADPAAALAQLQRATDRCRECPIGAHATQSVFGEGPVGAALMVVGEQPGDQEDLRGRPFVGPAGQLFDRALHDLGWSREALYVTNAVKHFKYELRGKRRIHKTPTQHEAQACLHWLESEMAQVRPQAVLALGATAARAVLGRPVAVMRERGQWQTGPRGEPVLVTLHPSALLRGDPQQRDEAYAAWLEDLSKATAMLHAAAGSMQRETAAR
ncbi:UdgX family uracil-DNA binding protein [Variovorax boronicumulans]|uniref:UdgX family uracil-DNA binding protein n=1 Tax=Variovorax boronicumulans TaxID=436515 RepID=UPI001C56C30B